MARLCVLCGSLCAYFFWVLNISAVSSSDDYHFYNGANDVQGFNHKIGVVLLNNRDDNQIHRQDVRPPPLPPSDEPDFGLINKETTIAPENTETSANKASPIDNLDQKFTGTQLPKASREIVKSKFGDDSSLPDSENNISLDLNVTPNNHNGWDNYNYYKSSVSTDPNLKQHYWVDLSKKTDAKISEYLSSSHRKIDIIKLSFEFPFYGYLIQNITIATGGFLYTGDSKTWLAATQYIAPLMANFDTSISTDSFIRYLDNGTAFTVEWENVLLKDKPNVGKFTFQTTLHQNGDIVFVYRIIPLNIKDIEDVHHPVTVGLSDAYIIDRTISFVRRRTVHEYHRIHFTNEDVRNLTVIYMKALPTCLQNKDCNSCIIKKIPNLNCQWCPSIQRCSSGVDRNRNYWLIKSCENTQINDEALCGVQGGLENSDQQQNHQIVKRDVPTPLPPNKPKTTVANNATLDPQESTLKPANTTQPIDNVDQKFTKTKLVKTVKNAPINNTTKISLEPTHLLGVNGTGQRKNVTTIEQPILLSNQTSKNDTKVKTLEPTYDDDDTLDVPSPDDFDSADFNKTLNDNKITMRKIDNHLYYNSSVITDPTSGQHYWADLSNRTDAKINEHLSHSHRRAATIKLSFDFPFYGHLIKNVTIATGGFLYTGEYVHSWLAATQYIAPLMANFDTSISNASFIRYLDNGTAFTVEWENVALQDKPNDGAFTFQTTLHQNGDVVFVYRNVPLIIEKIEDDHHPVKVGLSDAYIIDRTIFFVRRKTIYEYHRVDFFKEDIRNWTVIYLKALPTCLQNKDCNSCITEKIPNFNCQWCSSIKRCSNGLDRNRQEWLTKGCEKKQINNETLCNVQISGPDIFDENNKTWVHDANVFENQQASKASSRFQNNGSESNEKMGVSTVVVILFLIAMVSALAVWTFYAYRNPHTTSGQILIRARAMRVVAHYIKQYRPGQWSWRRGEARYTAATIHM